MRDRRTSDRRKTPRPGGRRVDDPSAAWLSISAYARAYGIDRGTVYKWIRDKQLHAYRIGKLIRIRNLPPDQHFSQPELSTAVETTKEPLVPPQ